MKFTIVGFLLICIAVAISLHQVWLGYPFFQLDDLHHETWMIMFGFCGVVLIGIFKGR